MTAKVVGQVLRVNLFTKSPKPLQSPHTCIHQALNHSSFPSSSHPVGGKFCSNGLLLDEMQQVCPTAYSQN